MNNAWEVRGLDQSEGQLPSGKALCESRQAQFLPFKHLLDVKAIHEWLPPVTYVEIKPISHAPLQSTLPPSKAQSTHISGLNPTPIPLVTLCSLSNGLGGTAKIYLALSPICCIAVAPVLIASFQKVDAENLRLKM